MTIDKFDVIPVLEKKDIIFKMNILKYTTQIRSLSFTRINLNTSMDK